ncbi:MAG TPA: DUF3068 domain-containing protein [Streptosporangiaceae bacterium]|nr:DUF3068 domain-containing protein [Streptosporangiaceae bacterium]
MRRALGIALAGLGAFLLVLALLVRGYVDNKLIKYPLNEYETTALQGSGISYFSPSVLKEVHGVTIRTTSTVKSVPRSGTSSTAVWDEFSYLYDETNHRQYQVQTMQFAFNRRTGELVNCCGSNVNGNTSILQTGLAQGLWPFGTKPQTYQVSDPVLNKARPARYAGTSTIDGISVYRFVEHVAPTPVTHIQFPPALAGMPGKGLVTLTEVYTGTNTFWVDPVTGAQLDTTQSQQLSLVDDTGVQRLLLYDGTLRFTPQSVLKVAGIDKSGHSQYDLVVTTLPLAGGLAGLVALAAGILLAWRRPHEQPRPADGVAVEPAAEPGGAEQGKGEQLSAAAERPSGSAQDE